MVVVGRVSPLAPAPGLVEDLAGRVELELARRRVAHPHRPGSAPALELLQLELDQPALAAHAIDDLQVLGVARRAAGHEAAKAVGAAELVLNGEDVGGIIAGGDVTDVLSEREDFDGIYAEILQVIELGTCRGKRASSIDATALSKSSYMQLINDEIVPGRCRIAGSIVALGGRCNEAVILKRYCWPSEAPGTSTDQ